MHFINVEAIFSKYVLIKNVETIDSRGFDCSYILQRMELASVVLWL